MGSIHVQNKTENPITVVDWYLPREDSGGQAGTFMRIIAPGERKRIEIFTLIGHNLENPYFQQIVMWSGDNKIAEWDHNVFKDNAGMDLVFETPTKEEEEVTIQWKFEQSPPPTLLSKLRSCCSTLCCSGYRF